ncbi:hypothetical protein P7K49_014637 [Saguinus oedipus]|uniref:Uncharacterized protein n=1 Tax=Saguinus oedipus TaxID=9490 RepID=A0ABQ9V6X5_SAGOE|nr:hypothetical protein P7K49_014637 [Saguinus oedipus]
MQTAPAILPTYVLPGQEDVLLHDQAVTAPFHKAQACTMRPGTPMTPELQSLVTTEPHRPGRGRRAHTHLPGVRGNKPGRSGDTSHTRSHTGPSPTGPGRQPEPETSPRVRARPLSSHFHSHSQRHPLAAAMARDALPRAPHAVPSPSRPLPPQRETAAWPGPGPRPRPRPAPPPAPLHFPRRQGTVVGFLPGSTTWRGPPRHGLLLRHGTASSSPTPPGSLPEPVGSST